MNYNPRRSLIALLALVALLLPVAAQDAAQPTVTGSAIAAQAFSAALDAAQVTPALSEDFQGTNRGLGLLCQNAADIALATRPMQQADTLTCNANGATFVETLFAADGLAFVASPDVEFLNCVGQADLDQMLVPSATAGITNWTSVNAAYADLPLSVVSTGLGSRAYAAADALVRGDGLRGDIELVEDSAAVIAQVAAGSGKFGIVTLAAAASAEGVIVLDYRNPEINTCIAPTLANVLNSSYTLGNRVFAYTAGGALEKPGVADALLALVSEEGQSSLATVEFLAVGETLAAQAAAVIDAGQTGRVFSLDQDPFVPTPGLTSAFTVVGGGAGLTFVKNSLTQFSQRNPTITVTGSYLGVVAGARSLCDGTASLMITDAPLTEEQSAACTEAGITTVAFPLAAAAPVLISNAANAELACLTTEQLATLWQASAEGAPESYSAVGLTDAPVILLAGGLGDSALNLMLASVAGGAAIVRDDVNVNADPLYNAAAAANVESALAVLSYAEYLAVVESGQQGIQLVSVDSGSGCVEPTREMIIRGEFPLSTQVQLIAAQAAMYDDAIQAALWFTISNANYGTIQSAELLGLDLDGLPALRVSLKAAFDAADEIEAALFAAQTEAAAAEATAAAEAAGTPTDEATPEATPQP